MEKAEKGTKKFTKKEKIGILKEAKQKGVKVTLAKCDLLERLASDQDREKGNDLADILIRHDWRKFRPGNQSTETIPAMIRLYILLCCAFKLARNSSSFTFIRILPFRK